MVEKKSFEETVSAACNCLGVEEEVLVDRCSVVPHRRDDPEFEILTIGTDPKHQRRGIGRMMMDNICYIADLKKAPLFLEVRVGNDPAIEMYKAYGFKHLGIRRNYYQPSGADAPHRRAVASLVDSG